jgi:hypothetical protein
LIIVIRTGPNQNITLSSIRFQKFGNRRPLDIIFCSNWEDGFAQAKTTNHTHALFVDSGIVFSDWDRFAELLKNYPHEGLIGHIVEDGEIYYLHQQCFYLELGLFEVGDFDCTGKYTIPAVQRSAKNIHDTYTPLWIKASIGHNTCVSEHFGEHLIARQLNNKRIVVNFHQQLREHKKFIYLPENIEQYVAEETEYFALAESQFWIFNNESLNILTSNTRLVTPASGLFWIFNLVNQSITNIDLVDISKTQIKFSQELWNTWDGVNYGRQVANFVKQNKIKNLQLDKPIDQLEELRLSNPVYIENTVNKIFDNQCCEYKIDFAELWTNRHRVTLSFTNSSIIDFLIRTKLSGFDLWMSNILDYKYNLLKHSDVELEQINNGTKWTLRR